MSAFDDYINGLEGKTDVNPLEVASSLLELHNQEIGTHVAKIDQLNGIVAEKDVAYTKLDGELSMQKARNFDLAMQIPGAVNPSAGGPNPTRADGGSITIDDLFQS